MRLSVIREIKERAAWFLAKNSGNWKRLGHNEFEAIPGRSKPFTRRKHYFPRYVDHTIQSKTSHHGERQCTGHKTNTSACERDARSQGNDFTMIVKKKSIRKSSQLSQDDICRLFLGFRSRVDRLCSGANQICRREILSSAHGNWWNIDASEYFER